MCYLNMSNDLFCIYTARLREGKEERFSGEVSPDFLQLSEDELTCEAPVFFEGAASVVGKEILLKLSAKTEVKMPCSVCNEWVTVPLIFTDFYYDQPLAEVRSGVFDFREVLREELVAQIPQFAECNGGRCSKRKEIENYTKKKEKGQNPFADLE